MAEKQGIKQIAANRQARHEYFVEESMEAGIELFGTEVKSLRNGGLNLKDSWCSFEKGSSLCVRCTSAPMRRAISLTVIRCGQKAAATPQGAEPFVWFGKTAAGAYPYPTPGIF